MAQGGLKKKSSKFVLSSKSKGKKASTPRQRKGPQQIAPKKAKVVAAQKVKNNLRKAIGRKIEQDLVTQASSEGENLRVLTSQQKVTTKNKKGTRKNKTSK